MTTRQEEQQATRRHRQGEQLQRRAAWARERADKQAVAAAIAATKAAHPACRCPLRRGMVKADLAALGAGCTDPHYCCPRLDTIRRKLGL